MRAVLIASLLSLSAATGGGASPPPPDAAPPAAGPVEAPWTITDPVVVTAPSPRLWKLTRGASTVWVLGVISPLPRGLAWNSAPLARAMQGAARVLLPPDGAAGVMDALGALIASRLPSGATLDTTLPPELDRRYRAALVRLGRDPNTGRRDKPAWAALMLELDFITSPGVDAAEPFRTVKRIARAAHAPVRQVATYRGTGVLGDLVSLPEADGEAALADAVAGVDFGLDHVAAAGRAWAIGDLRAVRANTSAGETPLVVFLHTSAGRQVLSRAVDDTTEALRSALATPGVTVAVLRLAALVQRGGALDRLRAEGVSVTEPTP